MKRGSEEVNLAYLAGLIDGEGCILIVRGKRSYSLRIQVTNNDLWMLTWVRWVFGGYITHPRPLPRRRQSHVWWLKSQLAADLLERLLPYLKTKQAQARIAVHFQSRVARSRGTGLRLSEEELEIRKAYKQSLQKIRS